MAKTISTLIEVYELLQQKDIDLTTEFSAVIKGKTYHMSLGRIWFNLILPEKYPKIIDESVNKKRLNQITKEIIELLSPADAAAALSFIGKEAFKMSSISPVTFDNESLILPEEIKQKKQNLITKNVSIEDFNKHVSEIATEYVDKISDNNFGTLVQSGATSKLGIADIGVLMVAKGPIMDLEGNIRPTITNSLMEGYTNEQYYDAAAEARRGYYIRAVGTADPGYLAKQTIYSNATTIISEMKDCGSTKYLQLFVRESIFENIIGRYYLDERIDKLVPISENIKKNILNKTILLRSPLYCKAKDGICPICYGKLVEKIDSNQIGMIAGSLVNESGINLYSMKARHKASQVDVRKVNFIQDLVKI